MTNLFTYEDLENVRETGEWLNYTGIYEPSSFWSNSGEKYWKSFDEEAIKKNMRELCPRIKKLKPKGVLEVGCGFGRCLSFVYTNLFQIGIPDDIVGIDFSKTMVETSKKFFSMFDKRDHIKILNADAGDLPFKDRSFDLTYTHVSLTHIPPKFIDRVINEISRVTKNWVIHIERFRFPLEHPTQHRWSHLLASRYEDLGWEIWENGVINEEDHTNILVLRRV